MALRNVLGFIPKYMRPPYGSCTRASGCLDYANQLGYHVINWDVDTRDFMFNTPNTIQSSKDIIKTDIPPYTNSPEVDSHLLLSHDTQYQTAYNLTEFMIKHVVDKGFRAITVGECLGDSPENWYINAESSTSECFPNSFQLSLEKERNEDSPGQRTTPRTVDDPCLVYLFIMQAFFFFL